jgi:hypothetical protein
LIGFNGEVEEENERERERNNSRREDMKIL